MPATVSPLIVGVIENALLMVTATGACVWYQKNSTILPSGSYEALPSRVTALTGRVIDTLPPPFETGDILAPPVATAVVNVVLLVVPQAVFTPLAFLGAIYQLYRVLALKFIA